MEVPATVDADDGPVSTARTGGGFLARLDAACRDTADRPGIEGIGCLLLDADGALRTVAATDTLARSLASAEESTGEGPGHEQLARPQAMLGPSEPGVWPRLAGLLASSPIGSMMASPVVCGPAPAGVVVAVSRRTGAWSDETLTAVRSLAEQLGGAVEAVLRDGRRAPTRGDPGDHRDAEVLGQLAAGLENRHELDRAVGLIARQTGASPPRAGWRLRQLATGMDVPALTIARRIITHGGLPHPHEFLTDASERSHREELARLALSDPLTGLANRVLLLDRLEHAVWRSQRGRDRPAVLYIDLDGFKLVNDTLGHDIGDHVLRTAASRIQASVRPQDTVGRMGGDEFAVVCEAVDGTPTAVAIARRIAGALEEPIPLDELGGSRARSLPAAPTVGASIGIAVAEPGQPAEDLLRAADAAMYRSKLGPGHITVHDLPASRPRRSGSG